MIDKAGGEAAIRVRIEGDGECNSLSMVIRNYCYP